ncbi:MAG: SDR family NAD(P)-dependent oxidoreductase [Lyngbya sp. HA4199-MV5]|jgi:uncharacterized oxidoreductase|nr:SDR family NAD(P)-dependent oxidoreductase [Lyngbya sp. HA4199-MV5]
MKTTDNTVLITGGATGIGLELAKDFVAKNNTVIICGRRAEKLSEAKKILPQIITYQCNLSELHQRRELVEFCTQNHPSINILVNNAGVQREINFLNGEADYFNGESEIAINLEACIHLTALFVPYFVQRSEAAIINVTSGLGIVPLSITPVYCATKAGLHSFSISLRYQLKHTSVKVFELIPPIVDTELDRGARDRRGQKDKGVKPEIVSKEAFEGLTNDQLEIPVGMVKILKIGSRITPELFLKMINKKVVNPSASDGK